jgi:hypothetical protein
MLQVQLGPGSIPAASAWSTKAPMEGVDAVGATAATGTAAATAPAGGAATVVTGVVVAVTAAAIGSVARRA